MLTKYNICIIFVVDRFLIKECWQNWPHVVKHFFLIELFDNIIEFEFIYVMFFNEFCLLV